MSTQTTIIDDTRPGDAPPCVQQAKPSESTCNIDCTNRFYLSREALYPKEKSRMSDATRLRGRDD